MSATHIPALGSSVRIALPPLRAMQRPTALPQVRTDRRTAAALPLRLVWQWLRPNSKARLARAALIGPPPRIESLERRAA
jgi:hypothetical protein